MRNILLAGVGGQGTVLASKLIAQCAINRGENARTAETIGMAQRGGCVVSHVRVGEHIDSPLIPVGEADVIIGFEPAEAVRVLPYLKPDGVVIVNTAAIKPVTDSLAKTSYDGNTMLQYISDHVKRAVAVNGTDICKKCGSPKVLNLVLVGAAIKNRALDFDMLEMQQAIAEKIPEKYREMNLTALKLGADIEQE